MKYTFEAEFEIGEIVYHRTPDSSQGIITDMVYKPMMNKVQYFVSFGRHPDDSIWCDEIELAREKTF